VNSIINYLEKYSDNIFVIQVWLLIIILATLAWVWFYNRRKYNHLKHQIPASVVKSYLDSIIQNSTALKSSLFRGGGLDVDPSSVPSVMPLTDLPGGTSVNLDSIDGDAALKAQISKLEAQLSDQKSISKELESSNATLEGIVKQKQERIEELEALLANASNGDGEDSGSGEAIIALTKERDELAENLKQYDIISGDLADLKRLKQENEQLKKALAEKGIAVPIEEPAEEVAPIVEPEVEEEPVDKSAAMSDEPAPFAEDAEEEEEEVVEASAPEKPEEEEEDTSPEDLLSEFEKMLK
jgi:hypothetical protein